MLKRNEWLCFALFALLMSNTAPEYQKPQGSVEVNQRDRICPELTVDVSFYGISKIYLYGGKQF